MLNLRSFAYLPQILAGSALRFLSIFVCVDPITKQKQLKRSNSQTIEKKITLASGDVNGDASPVFSGEDVKFIRERCICCRKLPLPPRDPRPPLPLPRRMPRANGLNVGDSSSSSIRIRRFRPDFRGDDGGCGVFVSAEGRFSGGIRTPANCRGVV